MPLLSVAFPGPYSWSVASRILLGSSEMGSLVELETKRSISMCLLSEVMGMTKNRADIFSEAAWEGHKGPDECPGICIVENGSASDCKMSQELLLGPATKKKPRKMSRYLRVEQQHP